MPFPTAVEVSLGFNCLAATPQYFFGFGFDPMSPPLPNGVLYSTPQPSRGWKVRVSRTLVRAIVKPLSICGLVVAPSSCFRGLRSVTCPSLLGPRVCHPFEQVSEWKACASCSRCFQLHMVLPGRFRQCCSIAMFPVLQYEELSEASWLMRLVCDSRVGSEGGGPEPLQGMICTCTRCCVVLSSCSSASMKRFLPRVGIARWLPPEPLVAKMLLSRGSSSFWTFFAFGLGGALLSSFSRWCLFTRFMSETRIIVLSSCYVGNYVLSASIDCAFSDCCC